MLIVFFFFFSSRRRHTRLQGDWSSDVCSSDLWASARSQQLVQPSVLAARSRTAQRSRTSARGFGLGSLARPSARTRFPPCVLAVCMARVERLWLWRSWRHGFLQFRYDFSSPKAGSADECGSEL